MSYFFQKLSVFALLCLSLTAQASAREHIIDRAFVEDPSGQWNLKAVQAQPLTPFTGLLTQGYGKGAIWVRLRIDSSLSDAADKSPLFLRIRPIYLDNIRLYDEAEGFAPRPAVGDRFGSSAQDEPGPFYLFKLVPGPAARELWLRIESTSTRLAHFEVIDGPNLRDSNLKIQSLSSLYLALIASFLIIGILQAFIRRDAINWTFSLYQLISFVQGAISLGYVNWWTDRWLAPKAIDSIFSALVVGLTFVVALYSYALLRERAQSRWRDFMLYGLFALMVCLVGMQFIGLLRLSLVLNAVAALILPVVFLIDAILQSDKLNADSKNPELSKAVLVTYFGLTMVFAYSGALPVLGWTSAAEFSLYWLQFYCLSSGLLMLGLLHYRAHVIDRQREILVAETRSANERAALERAQRLERQQLLNMLGHELKTPMATLKMLLGDRNIPNALAQRLSRPLTEMKDVIERTVQSGQLDEGGIELRWQISDLVSLIQEQLSALPTSDRVMFTVAGAQQPKVSVRTDPHFLGVIVRNLLDNALKYSPDQSKVLLSLSWQDAKAVWTLSVSNPVGRAGRPDPDKLFVRYWRSPSATYRSGSGQGLYIVYRLAGLLGGSLSLEPKSDSVCFKLAMPYDPNPESRK